MTKIRRRGGALVLSEPALSGSRADAGRHDRRSAGISCITMGRSCAIAAHSLAGSADQWRSSTPNSTQEIWLCMTRSGGRGGLHPPDGHGGAMRAALFGCCPTFLRKDSIEIGSDFLCSRTRSTLIRVARVLLWASGLGLSDARASKYEPPIGGQFYNLLPIAILLSTLVQGPPRKIRW